MTKLQKLSGVVIMMAMAAWGHAETLTDLGFSPNGRLSLVLKTHDQAHQPQLELIDATTSKTIISAPLDGTPINALKPVWSDRNDAVTVAIDYTTTNSQTLGFLKLPNGQFKSLSFALTGIGNLGKLGEPHEHWKKIRNFPVAWDTMSNSFNNRFIDIRTQVWDKSGQRFTVTESTLITADGIVCGR